MTQLDVGYIKRADEKYCESCGDFMKSKAIFCPHCGARQKRAMNKWILLMLTLFMGGIGIHKFYIRKNGQGLAYLLFCWTGVPGVIALVEFFIFAVTDSDELREQYPETTGIGFSIGLVAAGVVFVMLFIKISIAVGMVDANFIWI